MSKDHTPGIDYDHLQQLARAGSRRITRAIHERLPVGGWLQDIGTNENWRMNTIVRRHRDQSVPSP